MTTEDFKQAIETLLAEQNTKLVAAMKWTNKPLEQRLDEVNQHLKDLNGKVYNHALALAKGGERMDGLRNDLNELKGDRRSGEPRREEDKGENRRITVRDVAIVVVTISLVIAFLKFIGKL